MHKPLLMMRTKGLLGSFFGRHAGIPGLSKSTGNAHIPGHSTARTVPDLIGLTEAAAITACTDVDLIPVRAGLETTGIVSLQAPIAGTLVRAGTEVRYHLDGTP